MIIFILPSKHW